MKMQNLAVIFAIIIIPITIAVSIYVQNKVTSLADQTAYDTKLSNATYDAVKAFQLNELNSNTQNLATEKIRDIEASVQTFYNSLAMALKSDGYSEEDLNQYIPALVYTLYDGYYIYSPFKNIAKNPEKYENGLKPYIYYSVRYKSGNIDITVNYTLDNYITIYGTDKSGNYVTRSGYLIDPTDVKNDGKEYKGISINSENLQEINSETYASDDPYVSYVYIETENNQREKVYNDVSGWYRISLDKKRINLTNGINNVPSSKSDSSAINYYKEAKEFSQWVNEQFGELQIKDIVGYDSTSAADDGDKNIYYISKAKANDKVFKTIVDDNDPENEKSMFNDHRRNVIKYTINTNLAAAIAGYNTISQVNDTTYNFKMPILTEEDWDKVLNNVSVISFMQGLPIKSKYYNGFTAYNGYSIVTNNKNKEFVDPDFIYFTSSSDSTKYHNIYDSLALTTGNLIGYRNIDFSRRKIIKSDNTATYYYPQYRESCYNCIVTSSVRDDTKTFFEYISSAPDNIKKAYYTAIARERYNSYKSNVLY